MEREMCFKMERIGRDFMRETNFSTELMFWALL